MKQYIPWQFGVDHDAIGRGGAQDLIDKQLEDRFEAAFGSMDAADLRDTPVHIARLDFGVTDSETADPD